GSQEEALADIDEVWHVHPERSAVWFTRWLMLLYTGRLDEAEDMCRPGAIVPNGITKDRAALLFAVCRTMRLDRDARRPFVEQVLGSGPLVIKVHSLAAFGGFVDLAYEHLFAAMDRGEVIVPEVDPNATAGVARAYIGADLFHFDAAVLRQD